MLHCPICRWCGAAAVFPSCRSATHSGTTCSHWKKNDRIRRNRASVHVVGFFHRQPGLSYRNIYKLMFENNYFSAIVAGILARDTLIKAQTVNSSKQYDLLRHAQTQRTLTGATNHTSRPLVRTVTVAHCQAIVTDVS